MSAIKAEKRRLREKEIQLRLESERKAQERLDRLQDLADSMFARAVDELENNSEIRTEVVQHIAQGRDDVVLIRLSRHADRHGVQKYFPTSLAGGPEALNVDWDDMRLFASCVSRGTYDHKFIHPGLKGWGIRAVGCGHPDLSYDLVEFIAYKVRWYSKWF